MLRTSMVIALALGVAAPAGAAGIEGPTVRGQAPVASTMVLDHEGVSWDQVLFYRDDAARGGGWILRRAFRPIRNPERVTWATSRTCPAAGRVAERLLNMPLVSDTANFLGGQVQVRRTSGGRLEGAMGTTGGGPLDAFVAGAMRDLEGCWRSGARPGEGR